MSMMESESSAIQTLLEALEGEERDGTHSDYHPPSSSENSIDFAKNA